MQARTKVTEETPTQREAVAKFFELVERVGREAADGIIFGYVDDQDLLDRVTRALSGQAQRDVQAAAPVVAHTYRESLEDRVAASLGPDWQGPLGYGHAPASWRKGGR